MIYIGLDVGEMCFIPMNVHNEMFNGARQLRWQHLSPVVSTFSTSIRLLSSFFIKHCIIPPSFSLFLSICFSLSVVPHPVFLICGLSLRFVDVDVFSLQYKVLCSYSSSDHFHTDAVVPSGDHYSINIVAKSYIYYIIVAKSLI